MTLRESVHQIVDTIPESELDDLRNGRTISHEELRRKYGLFAVDEVDRIVEVTMIEPRGQVYNRL